MTKIEGKDDFSVETMDVFKCAIAFLDLRQFKDQYDMEEKLRIIENEAIDVTFEKGHTVKIKGLYTKVLEACERLKELMSVKSTENVPGEDQASVEGQPKGKRNRQLIKNLTPQVDAIIDSMSQLLPIDNHIWYYILEKYGQDVSQVSSKNSCHIEVVEKASHEGTTYLQISPRTKDSFNREVVKKQVDDAVEEFAALYQKISSLEIVEEKIELPLGVRKEMLEPLKGDLRKIDVLLNFSESGLIGPGQKMDDAKKMLDKFVKRFTAGPKNQYDGRPLEFKTPNGITVHVSQGNLVNQRVDAIVNPANSALNHGGGAAKAIADAAGYELETECRDYIRKYRVLSTTWVTHTTSGKLRPKIKFVIHVVGPHKGDYKDVQLLYHDIQRTVYNCLHYANSQLNIKSIAIPAISSGIFGVPLETVADASFAALMEFDNSFSDGNRSICDIHFLNNDEKTFSIMKMRFEAFYSSGASFDQSRYHSNEAPYRDAVISEQPQRNSENFFNQSDSDYEHISSGETADMPGGKPPVDTKVLAASSADQDDLCIICMDKIVDEKKLDCGHKFCRQCIDTCFAKCQPKCPSCGKVYGVLMGNQPKGTMNWKESREDLPGYNNCGMIIINYYFPDGKQGENHPNPGQYYRGTGRTAYLPANKEGNKILKLLKRAFDAKLIFTIGRSNTTGHENVVVWNDVHHKTTTHGQYGYPDPTYLQRVREELAAKGIE